MSAFDSVDVVAELRDLACIRSRCLKLYNLAIDGQLKHFRVQPEKLDDVVRYILAMIEEEYPTLDIPFHSRWRHFEAGGVARHLQLQDEWMDCDALERARRHIDLVVVSVLIDAGAGPSWNYLETNSSRSFTRSEGLGVASFWMFANGLFSSHDSIKHRVDAEALIHLTLEDLEKGFQVSANNPLVGLSGRLELLKNLGFALQNRSDFFGQGEDLRPGHLVDFLLSSARSKNTVELKELWKIVLEGLQSIWPSAGRTHWNGINLGDVWHHSALGTPDHPMSLIPFHKLSQWLTYSLLEPLASSGIGVKGCDALTGLPEYRNGGLLIDFEVLVPKDLKMLSQRHLVGSEWVVEWRALTIVVLDLLAAHLQRALSKSPEEFPLAKVLEAGTWKAGRKVAAQKRTGGHPPVEVMSDGTVF